MSAVKDIQKMNELSTTTDSTVWDGDGIWVNEPDASVGEEPVITPGYDMRKLYRETTPWELQDADNGKNGETDNHQVSEGGKKIAPGTCVLEVLI